MDVVKIVLVKDQALFGKIFLEGSEFYITSPYRKGNTTIDTSDIFDGGGMDNEFLGTIEGYYFDFGTGNRTVFDAVKED